MTVAFERWTERARLTIVLAQEEARALKHNYIGTEHMLLGLLREGLAARTLAGMGFSADSVRQEVVRIVGWGEELAEGQVPFSPRARKVCELALREALSLGHNYIGTEHVLLGMVREDEGTATRILSGGGWSLEAIRNRVIADLKKPKAPNGRVKVLEEALREVLFWASAVSVPDSELEHRANVFDRARQVLGEVEA